VQAYETVIPRQRGWSAIGWGGFAAAVLIMAFYTDVAGWVFAYVFKSFRAFILGSTLGQGDFAALAGGTWEPLAWQLGVLACFIIASGVSKGIERATKTLMPLLFVLLLICDVRALSLPGASTGVSYLFRPDLAKLTAPVLLAALGLAFFKLSLGMGTMTPDGSSRARTSRPSWTRTSPPGPGTPSSCRPS